jgi:hypothetical protein
VTDTTDTRAKPTVRPIRIRLASWIDVLLVHDPEQIQWLNQHPDVEREIDPSTSWLHRLVNKRFKLDLGFGAKVLPVFLSRKNTEREGKQQKLHARLENLRSNHRLYLGQGRA